MTETHVRALPDDIVQLMDTHRKGRILAWYTQLPIDLTQLAASHYAVQPIDADDQDDGRVMFWPRNRIIIVERQAIEHTYRLGDNDDFRL